jgi:hypothetical protein
LLTGQQLSIVQLKWTGEQSVPCKENENRVWPKREGVWRKSNTYSGKVKNVGEMKYTIVFPKTNPKEATWIRHSS